MLADFDAFVRAHRARLDAAVRRMARPYGQESDDALQEALLRAYAHRAELESETHAVNFVCRVAHGLLCDQRKSWYGRRVVTADYLPEAAYGTTPDPAEEIVRRDTRQRVLAALAHLQPEQRLVLWQHAVDGRSYADIARESSRPLATVRSTALRARAVAQRFLVPGDRSFGLGLAVRLRTWRVALPGLPGEPVAAAIALALGAGGLAAAAAPPAAAAPQVAHAAVSTVAAPVNAAAPGRIEASPVTVALPLASLTTVVGRALPGTRPVQNAVSVGIWPFAGTGGGSCTFGLASYTCGVAAEVTAWGCRAVATGGAELAVCSWSLDGTLTGPATGVAGLHRCAGETNGSLTVRFGTHHTYDAPVHLVLSDGSVHATASFFAGSQPVTFDARFPYVCAPDQPATAVSGTMKVTLG